MSDEEGSEGTLTPEVVLKQIEERLAQETERLVKLYDAYEQQEKEIVGLKAEIEVLEKEVIDKEIEREGMDQLLTDKDNRVRDLEKSDAKSRSMVDHLEPELSKMDEKFTREKDRLGRVFEIAEELDTDLRLAVAELKARDDWYVSHMQVFEDLNRAIKNRYEMIEAAVEAERKSAHMARAIQDRLEEAIEARAAEAAEAEDSDDDGEEE